jgi:hypothetical protein
LLSPSAIKRTRPPLQGQTNYLAFTLQSEEAFPMAARKRETL